MITTQRRGIDVLGRLGERKPEAAAALLAVARKDVTTVCEEATRDRAELVQRIAAKALEAQSR